MYANYKFGDKYTITMLEFKDNLYFIEQTTLLENQFMSLEVHTEKILLQNVKICGI